MIARTRVAAAVLVAACSSSPTGTNNNNDGNNNGGGSAAMTATINGTAWTSAASYRASYSSNLISIT